VNPEPEEHELDPSKAIEDLPDHENYGDDAAYFRACRTCVAISSFTPHAATFMITPHPRGRGYAISFVIRKHAFSIEVNLHERGTLISLIAARADSGERGERVFDGRGDSPEEWEGLLQTICRVEGFGATINHSFNLRSEWSAYLRGRQGFEDDRGF
jgi:hypothetical protein